MLYKIFLFNFLFICFKDLKNLNDYYVLFVKMLENFVILVGYDLIK